MSLLQALTKALGGYVLWDVGDMSFEKESKVCNLFDFLSQFV